IPGGQSATPSTGDCQYIVPQVIAHHGKKGDAAARWRARSVYLVFQHCRTGLLEPRNSSLAWVCAHHTREPVRNCRKYQERIVTKIAVCRSSKLRQRKSPKLQVSSRMSVTQNAPCSAAGGRNGLIQEPRVRTWDESRSLRNFTAITHGAG